MMYGIKSVIYILNHLCNLYFRMSVSHRISMIQGVMLLGSSSSISSGMFVVCMIILDVVCDDGEVGVNVEVDLVTVVLKVA